MSWAKVTMFVRSVITLTYFFIMSIPCFVFCAPWLLVSHLYKATVLRKGAAGSVAPCVVIFAASKSKSLHYIRLFKDKGYRTVTVGSGFYITCCSGWSIYCDKYYTITAPLTPETEQLYIEQVLEIVSAEKPDIIMQIEPRYTPVDARANKIIESRLPNCRILAFETETYSLLDNKMTFNAKMHELGVRAPHSKLIKSEGELRELVYSHPNKKFILKPLQYVQADRVDIRVPRDVEQFERFVERKQISESRQFILQDELVPPESCSCTLVVDSRIIAHNTCDQTVDRMWQNSINRPELDAWVRDFLDKYDEPLTGFLTFDFMCSPSDGLPYPLECNPRVQTSHILFTREDNVIGELSKHLLDKDYTCPVIRPSLTETYWLLREIALILQSLVKFQLGVVTERVGVVVRGKEAVFEWMDPLPFLILNFVQIPGRIAANLFGRQLLWNQVDYMCGNPLIN